METKESNRELEIMTLQRSCENEAGQLLEWKL